MAITNQIPATMISGVPGEVAFDGPTRALTAVLNTATEANNVIGRAFTYNDKAVESVKAGGAAATFAGILIHPKAYSIDGLTMKNGAQAELLFMGEVYVQLATTGAVVGDLVYYTDATGALGHGTAAAGQTQIANCTVSRHNVSVATPTLAVIKLTQ